MNVWFDYRTAWSSTPALVAMFVLGVALVVVGIIGTVGTNILAIGFIPGLIVLLGHHLLVAKRV